VDLAASNLDAVAGSTVNIMSGKTSTIDEQIFNEGTI
jgi:hypothetical protein